MRELGFTNLETEGTIEIYYAQYCERHSQSEQARHTLVQLRAKVDKALATRKVVAYRQLRQEIDILLSKLGNK